MTQMVQPDPDIELKQQPESGVYEIFVNKGNTGTSCNPKAKISLIGIRRQKNGRYAAEITDQIRHKKVWLGTFDTIEEASQAYFSKKCEFENEKLSQQGNKESKRIHETTRVVGVHKKNKRGKYNSEQCTNKHTHSEQDGISEELVNVKQGLENVNCEIFQTESAGGAEIDVPNSNSSYRETDPRIDSHKICTADEAFCEKKEVFLGTVKESSKGFNSCLVSNVHGTESSDECINTSTSNPKAKISLIGVRKQKSGRYGAVITDQIKHKKVWLGTFDTAEEASQAYFSKKSELEKLSQQGNKKNKPKKNSDQIQPESPVVETLNTAAWGRRKKRTGSQGKEPGSSKETSCLMANVHGTKSSDLCNTSTSCNPKAKRSLIGIRSRKSGRYAAVITDRIKHTEVCLGTFDTIEEASHTCFSKKSEFEKLSQQGNKENKPKKKCDQIQQPESSPVVVSFFNMANDQTLDTASESGRDKTIDSHKTTTHIIGANKSKTAGKYTSEITNPITKKKIWLGTFGTAEEASQAYQYKKLEFQKLLKAKQQQCTNKQTHSKQDGKSEEVVTVKQGHENVNCEPFLPKSAGGSPEIDVPSSNSSNGGTDQRTDSYKIGTAEEAFHVYPSKKLYSQSSKKVEMQSNMPTDSSAGEKQKGQDNDEDLCMGEWVQLPGNRAVKFSLKLGLPVIDNYGSLLGEFSSLDDLSIR
ncbi:hypothetical protein K7X08_013314 [Anisodus acutangulus]|uniref:AP2/ERF domain-containing protein n=1 Tax=Anisodus acutangulus TaxID=402998 RepID=A0A9Q1MFV8_9SOLA|nr:hypothetical protein K7X08_013314 [Anisodus acutangulus]